jgi:hypothetical protein
VGQVGRGSSKAGLLDEADPTNATLAPRRPALRWPDTCQRVASWSCLSLGLVSRVSCPHTVSVDACQAATFSCKEGVDSPSPSELARLPGVCGARAREAHGRGVMRDPRRAAWLASADGWRRSLVPPGDRSVRRPRRPSRPIPQKTTETAYLLVFLGAGHAAPRDRGEVLCGRLAGDWTALMADRKNRAWPSNASAQVGRHSAAQPWEALVCRGVDDRAPRQPQ